MGNIIRFAEHRDAEAVLSIYRPYVESTTVTFEYNTPSLEAFEKRMETIQKRFPWLVCETDGEIAGYAYGSPQGTREAYQWNAQTSVYIAENFKRRGAATALYGALLSLLKIQGYRTVYALISVPNSESEAFHKKCGFVPLGIHHSTGFKMGKWLDVLWMERQINTYDVPPGDVIPAGKIGEKVAADIFDRCGKNGILP